MRRKVEAGSRSGQLIAVLTFKWKVPSSSPGHRQAKFISTLSHLILLDNIRMRKLMQRRRIRQHAANVPQCLGNLRSNS